MDFAEAPVHEVVNDRGEVLVVRVCRAGEVVDFIDNQAFGALVIAASRLLSRARRRGWVVRVRPDTHTFARRAPIPLETVYGPYADRRDALAKANDVTGRGQRRTMT